MSFNFIDQITIFEAEKLACAKKIISTQETAYIENHKLFPMLLVEAIGQLNAWITMEMNGFRVRPVAILYETINIYGTVNINDGIEVKTQLKHYDEATSLFDGQVIYQNKILIEVIDAAGSFLNIDDFANPDDYKNQFLQLQTHKITSNRSSVFEASLFYYDEIHIQDAQNIHAKKKIAEHYPFFADHFPKKPVLPISILLQNNINLAQHFLEQKINFHGKIAQIQLNKIKMRDFILPRATLGVTMEFKHTSKNLVFSFRNFSDEKLVCRGEICFIKGS